MSKVDFYLLRDADENALLSVGCRLVEKAWQQGNRVYVLTDSTQRSMKMDQMLWSFRQDSFVPHARRDDDDTDAPVLIGELDSLPPNTQVLVNLSDQLPTCARECERVAELVPGDDDARSRARQRFRSYREQGAQLDSHEI